MKVKLTNIYYPKPLLNEKSDDYINNVFELIITEQNYDKKNQKLKLKFKIKIENETIKKNINLGKIVPILHLEQKTQRDLTPLSLKEETEKEIDLYQYATTEEIEILGVLYCKESFYLDNAKEINEIYQILDNNIYYERGDIVGFSNEISIKLPEDKKIGSIFNVVKDTDNILKGQPFNISLQGDLIQILVDADIHNKFVTIYNKDQYVKRLMFASLVEPAIVSAYTEMFNSYELYKDKKWCRTLSSKIEKVKRIQPEEIFISENYDLNKLYEYVNIALGDLYKDAINIYYSGLEG